MERSPTSMVVYGSQVPNALPAVDPREVARYCVRVVAHYHAMGATKCPRVEHAHVVRWLQSRVVPPTAWICRSFAQDGASLGVQDIARVLAEYAEICLVIPEGSPVRMELESNPVPRTRLKTYPPAWQSHFEEDIRGAGIAIVDATVQNENVAGELRTCVRHLAPHRILMVARTDRVPRGLDEDGEGALRDRILTRLDALGAFAHGRFGTLQLYETSEEGRTALETGVRRFMLRLVVAEYLQLPVPPESWLPD